MKLNLRNIFYLIEWQDIRNKANYIHTLVYSLQFKKPPEHGGGIFRSGGWEKHIYNFTIFEGGGGKLLISRG